MKKILFTLITISFLASCVSDPSPYTFVNTDSEFEILLNQRPTQNGPELIIELRSIDRFTCDSVTIIAGLTKADNELEIVISDLQVPENCFLSDDEDNLQAVDFLTQARKDIVLDLDFGNYIFTIMADELFVNNGTLISSDDSYQIEFEETEGIIIGRSAINKLPNNHIWGSFDVSASNITAEELIEGILAYTHRSEKLISGDYGLFFMASSEEVSSVSLAESLPHNLFALEVSDYDGLVNHLQEIRDEYPMLDITVYHSNGSNL